MSPPAASSPEPAAAVRALLEASRELAGLLAGEDETGIAAALERREAALEELTRAFSAGPSLDDGVAALLAEARRTDAEALKLARGRLDEIGVELERVRRARQAARSLAPTEPGARFVDKRV